MRESVNGHLSQGRQEGADMTTRMHFSFRIDRWDSNGDDIIDHVAGIEDYAVARAPMRLQ
jgi:hypothetical protein